MSYMVVSMRRNLSIRTADQKSYEEVISLVDEAIDAVLDVAADQVGINLNR